MSLSIESTTDSQGATTLLVCGEVDVSNASELRDAVDAALSAGPSSLVVDISQTPYIDSTGIGVLVGAAHRCADAGCALSVARPQRNVARVLALLGVGADLNIVQD